MPGELLQRMAINDSSVHTATSSVHSNIDLSLYLIVRPLRAISKYFVLISSQSNDDIVYEQDIIREAGSVKPWLRYVDFKHQHGTLLEQAYVG